MLLPISCLLLYSRKLCPSRSPFLLPPLKFAKNCNKKVKKMHNLPSSSSAESSSARSSPPPPPESSDPVDQTPPMKNTVFYEFLPSKADEDVERATKTAHEVKIKPVQIRDEAPLPRSESDDYPTLYRVIDEYDLESKKIPIRDNVACHYMFPHWPTSVVQNIEAGHKYYVTIRDDTDCRRGGDGGDGGDGDGGDNGDGSANQPLYFRGLNVYFAKCQRTSHYSLYFSDVFLARQIKVGDIILYNWDTQNGYFIMEIISVGA